MVKPHDLRIFNSLTGEKEAFVPLSEGLVGLYVCGPTVYSDVHLGNCRTFISFDLVFRYLRHLGYKVRYVRNITDAGHLENDADEGEDKVAKKARLEKLEPMEVVQRYTVGFRHVMGLFNALSPSIEPTATGHIVEQIEMIKSLLGKQMAYEVNGSVYFNVPDYMAAGGEYGELSKRLTDDLYHNTRELDGQSEKRSPLDFALWKKASPMHIMRWPSPWGEGFPGWHLECSVMSSKYLGETFDIHGGGMDLKFPHHECEIAQCKAHTGKSPVRFWMHGNMLTLNGKRMSKSTGNTILPLELFEGSNSLLSKAFSPAVVRFFMMQAHYRSVLDFSNEALAAAEKGFMRLMEAWGKLGKINPAKMPDGQLDIDSWVKDCYAALDDDFNSPVLVAHLFDAVRWINAAYEGKLKPDAKQLNTLAESMQHFIVDILGLQPPVQNHEGHLEAAMDVLLELRRGARMERNWALSDAIRDQLASKGIVLKDGANGTQWTLES